MSKICKQLYLFVNCITSLSFSNELVVEGWITKIKADRINTSKILITFPTIF